MSNGSRVQNQLAPAGLLPDKVADLLLDRIVSGNFNSGDALPSEDNLASAFSVSRLTLREAVKSLIHAGVVEVRRGKGTCVCDVSQWSPLEPRLLRARVRLDGPRESVTLLLEARRAVERGATESAAARRKTSDLAALRRALSKMEKTTDKTKFAEADLEFHSALFVASKNPLLGALLQPVEELLHDHRVLTSSAALARRHAIAAHRTILEYVASRDVVAAGMAMVVHIDQTIADVIRFGLEG